MKKIYSILGKGIKIVAYIALVMEVVEALRKGLLKIHPELEHDDEPEQNES